jgi:predicted acylesterase/phospholipase RssA
MNPQTSIESPEVEPSSQPTDTSVFDVIALSMSGGGFRAAAYALGTLKGLDSLGLLGNVQILSTISGGTITGAYYALHRKRGTRFATIYDSLYALLAADDILPRALDNWKAAISSQQRQYKLIRSFSDVYDQHLYENALFGEFFTPVVNPLPTPPLQTVVFGATELYSGTAFRFQYADLPDKFTTPDNVLRQSYRIGNGNVHIRHDRARKMRLSDMVAASSCFPAGFEPLVLPDDFPTTDTNDLLFFSGTDAQLPINRLALLDGGIYDNQGIEGLVIAEQRNQAYRQSPEGRASVPGSLPKPTTLFLVADVASAGMGLYDTPAPGPARDSERSFRKWGRLLHKVNWAFLIALVTLGFIQFGLRHGGSFGLGLLSGLLSCGLALLWAGSWALQTLVGKLKAASPAIFRMALPPLRSLTISQLIYLLRIRGSSVFELLNSVFLRRVRSLNYGLLYDDENETDTKRIPATIISSIIGSILNDYQMTFLRDRLQPVMETIQTASAMSTTLWWLDDKKRMDPIIDSAQITLYWRIVRYVERKDRLAKQTHKPFILSPRDKAIYEQAKDLLLRVYHVTSPDIDVQTAGLP